MLQPDGSRHDWLDGRGSSLTIVGAVDGSQPDSPGLPAGLQPAGVEPAQPGSAYRLVPPGVSL